MSYISDIFDRLDLQNIREFILHGVECIQIEDKPYEQRLEAARKPAIEAIKCKFPEMNEYEKITNEIYSYATVTQDVYMEIGMQCGAILALQLLSNAQTSLVPKRD